MLRWKLRTVPVGGGGPDLTPDPISYNTFDVEGSQYTTENQTISGIDEDITIRIDFTTNRDSYSMTTRVNGVNVAGPTTQPNSHTVTVSSGDTLSFFFSVPNGNRARPSVTVVNESDGNAVLATFNGEIDND